MIRQRLFDVWRDLDRQQRLFCGYLLIALLAAALAWSYLSARTSELERKRAAREAVLRELMPLKATYFTAKGAFDARSGRVSAVGVDDSPARLIEETGIKGKGVKISPLKGEDRPGFLEDAADVRIEGITANEAINLLYRIEKGSRPIVLKKAQLKVRFDDPSRFDLVLVMALLKPVPGQPR